MRHPWRQAGNPLYQRVRSLQSDPQKPASCGKEVQALGHIRGASGDLHTRYVCDRGAYRNPDLAIAAFQALKAEREKRQALEEAVAVQAQQIAELKPKATYYDVVLKCKDAVNISVIAKDYGWSAQRMNEYLHKKGVQYKREYETFSVK